MFLLLSCRCASLFKFYSLISVRSKKIKKNYHPVSNRFGLVFLLVFGGFLRDIPCFYTRLWFSALEEKTNEIVFSLVRVCFLGGGIGMGML